MHNLDRQWIFQLSWALLAFLISTSASTAGESELPDAQNAVAPIVHEPMYRGERELFSYAPRFTPNPIGFSPDNKPYIRAGNSVQTPDNDGTWTNRPIAPSITRYFQRQSLPTAFEMVGGQFVDQRVVMDDLGDAYTLAKLKHVGRTRLLLLHSRDGCVTWDVYPLPPLEHARLEFRDGNNTMTRPPAALIFKDTELGIVLPRRADDGSLIVDRAATVTNQSLLVPNHSGGGNSVITLGDRTYVVYPSTVSRSDKQGTSQFVVALSRDTGQIITGPTLLGTVGFGRPDPHYLPAITADSKGVLHVVLGSHHNSLYYLRSTLPNDASRWTTPTRIGKIRDPKSGGHTYPALLCDSQDRLHVVTRWAGDGYYFRLVYIRGNATTGRFEPQTVLVRPFRNMYSNWYHHLSLDRQDRLFLDYRYYGNQLSAQEIRAYRQKWPEDGLPADTRPGSFPKSVRPHDPAMLFSDDAGTTWHLTTDDLLRP